MTRRLLVVEDDLALRVGLRDAFVREGLDVTVAVDGDVARDLLLGRHFDLVILDVMLPGRSGLELLRELRALGAGCDVILLTARGDETDRVLGLELGADDYVVKPFSLRELVARVRARLRRLDDRAQAAPDSEATFTLGGARVDLAAFTVTGPDGAMHDLSPKEAGMLRLLWRERGRVIARERFLDEVWGRGQPVGPRTVDTHMLNLRHKVEADPRRPRFLRTVHGAGYRLEVEGDVPGRP